MPLVMKKNGIRKPYPIAVSFESRTATSWPCSGESRDQAGDEAAEQQVEPEVGGERDEAEDEDHGEADGELAARFDRTLQQRPSLPSRAHGEEAGDDGERDEDDEDHRFVERVRRSRGSA